MFNKPFMPHLSERIAIITVDKMAQQPNAPRLNNKKEYISDKKV